MKIHTLGTGQFVEFILHAKVHIILASLHNRNCLVIKNDNKAIYN